MPITVKVPKQELYDDNTKEFLDIEKDYELILEHSLVSISKWESKWHKPYPYINQGMQMTVEESNSYIKCMTINKDIPDVVYYGITPTVLKEINDYINDPMSATKVRMPPNNKPDKQILTSELLYYFMFKLGIPKECEKWHINRLLKLLEVYSAKDGNETNKMSRSEMIARNKAINAKNRAKFHTKG